MIYVYLQRHGISSMEVLCRITYYQWPWICYEYTIMNWHWHLSFLSHFIRLKVLKRMKMLFTILKYLFSFQVFKIWKLGNWWHHKLNKILLKYEEKCISINLYQKCLAFCSKTLLDGFHNMALTILFLWLLWNELIVTRGVSQGTYLSATF